ncbi:MAG: hypothetical protein GXY03_10530 [Solirubrobacterales bacterium]|nr:hypothetical protein [Solirubrobacterales bacterium]
MKRYLIPALVLAFAALAIPTSAQARVIEMGAGAQPAGASNCPNDPCVAAYQMTAYQGRSGNLKNPFVVPRPGYIVAFSVTLGELTDSQIEFFDGRFGADPQVQLALLRRSTRKGKLGNHRLMRQSEIYDVSDYLGSTPTFALSKPLRVGKDFRVALTIPTWAPVLDTVDLAGTNWWRASRPKGECGKDDELSPPSVQEELKSIVDYRCTYFKSRLLYTATYVPDPRPTTKAKSNEARRKATRRAAAARAARIARRIAAANGGAVAP